MPSKRESDDYVHHVPNTVRSTVPTQYNIWDGIWLVIECVTYLLGWCIGVSILIERFNQEEPPSNRGFYVLYFVLPHIAAGLKNIQYHYKQLDVEEDGNGSIGWIAVCLLFPFSPLYRYYRAFKYGLAENDEWESKVRYVDETVTLGVLRLFDIVLGDFPTLVLLVTDDVLARSEDWLNLMSPEFDPALCGGRCMIAPPSTLDFWTIFRMFIILSKMAQGITFYIAMVKRLQRLQHADRYSNLRGKNAKQGRLNIVGVFLLYSAQFFLIASRIMGYSMISQCFGAWIYLAIGLRWLIHTSWHLLSLLNTHGITPTRSVSSFTMGAVWLVALTNEEGGKQLGRFILYYAIAFSETLLCGFTWNGVMQGSGDYFAYKISWATLITFFAGILLHASYYALLHPGSPSISKDGFKCCTGDRADENESDDEERDNVPA